MAVGITLNHTGFRDDGAVRDSTRIFPVSFPNFRVIELRERYDPWRLPSNVCPESIGVTANNNNNFPVFHVSKLASLTFALSSGNEWRDDYTKDHTKLHKR